MANQIVDGRTLISNADSTSGWEGSQETDIVIQGSASMGRQISNGGQTILYDAGSVQTAWANSVFYLWVNCTIVGLLLTKANGGFRVRFAGASASNYFEVYVGGSDDWPVAVSGGWVQFVVDVELAHANSDATGGTKPTTSQLQRVGIYGQTTSMTKNVANTFVDEVRYLPDGTAGIRVEGRNGGTTDWTFADIRSQLGIATGTFRNGPGGSYWCNTSIQFGANDTSTHGFNDTNAVVLFENQEFVPSDLYKISALGNSGGTTNVTLGVKTGTGDDATGAQGVIFSAASAGARYALDFDDPNVDGVNLYGCSFIHGGDLQLDDPAVSAISCTYVDCTSARVDNSEQLRCKVIDANTADGAAFMVTDDLGDIVYCDFEFSDGHAIELTTPRVATQTSKGNKFTGYGSTGTNDAAIYNNTAGAVTVNVTEGLSPTYRNGTSASTTIANNVSVTFAGMKDNTEVRVYQAGTTTELDGIENATAGSQDNRSFVASVASGTSVDYWVFATDYEVIYQASFTWPSTAQTININQRRDRNYSNP